MFFKDFINYPESCSIQQVSAGGNTTGEPWVTACGGSLQGNPSSRGLLLARSTGSGIFSNTLFCWCVLFCFFPPCKALPMALAVGEMEWQPVIPVSLIHSRLFSQKVSRLHVCTSHCLLDCPSILHQSKKRKRGHVKEGKRIEQGDAKYRK